MKQLNENQLQNHEDFKVALVESEVDILGAVLYDMFLYGTSDSLMMNNLKMEYDGVIGKKLIIQTMKNLDIDLNYSDVFNTFMKYRIKIT